VSDGTTTAKATASVGTAVVDAGAVLFPLASVSVLDGSNNVVETYSALTDMGGGDTFAYSSIVSPFPGGR